MSSLMLPSGTVFGQEVQFSSVSGEVVGVDRQTDTHFSTTSGSVMVLGNFVSVTAPSVTAHTRASKTVWIQQEDGTELSIAVPDDVQARAGHKVTLLVASGVRREYAEHQWCAVVNYTTGRWSQIDSLPPVSFLVQDMVGGGGFLLMLFPVMWVVAGTVCTLLFNSSGGNIFFINLFLTIALFLFCLVMDGVRTSDARAVHRDAVARAAGAVLAAGFPERVSATTEAAPG